MPEVEEWRATVEWYADEEVALRTVYFLVAPKGMDVPALVRNEAERRGWRVVEVEKMEKIEVKGVLEYPDVLEVEVVEIVEKTGKEIYGEKAGESADQKFFHVLLENKEYGIKFHEPIRDSRTPDGYVPERSKLGKWIKIYTAPPYVGQKVKAIKDAKGYYRVKLV